MSRWITLVGLLCVPLVTAAEPPPPNPDKPVDYVKWLNDKYGQGITENAADVYLEAVSSFVLDEELLELAVKTDPKQWSSKQRDELREYITGNADSLKSYARAARMSKCYFALNSESGSMSEVPLPDWAALRWLAKLSAGRARLRLLQGDVDGAVEDAATLLCVGRHMQAQPYLKQYLAGIAIGALTYDAVLLEIPRLVSDPVDYMRILKTLKNADKPPRRPVRQIECELLFQWDVAQRSLHDADGDGRFESATSGGQRFTFETPQELAVIVRESRDHCAGCKALFVADYQESSRRAEELDRNLKAQKGETPLGTFAPSLTRFSQIQRGAIASRNAYRTIFLLHAYQAEHGSWPQTLKEALPGKRGGVAIDPFSNKPFGYQLKDGKPFLYSVSTNGVDDGGEPCRDDDGKPKWGDTGDYVFWPRATPSP